MLLYGLLALFQVTLLPGFIACRLLGLKDKPIAIGVYSFALSLILNYFIVLTLVIAGLYTKFYVTCVIAVECLAIAGLRNRVNDRGNVDTKESGPKEVPDGHWLSIASILVVSCYLVYILQAIAHPAFEGWDTIFSWNKWAVELSNGSFPTNTWHYPQLLPANWSLTYVMVGDEAVQLYARVMMPLFSIGSLLMILDLGIRTGCRAYYIALLILGWLLWYYFDYFITEGFADIPASFFGFTAYYLLLKLRIDATSDWSKRFFLGAIVAASAGLVKQSGLVVPLMYGFLTYFLFFQNQPRIPVVRRWTHLALFLLLTVAICGPSYLYQQIQINQNKAASEIAYVTNAIHQNRSPFARIIYGVGKIGEATKAPIGAVLITIITIGACLGIGHRISRLLLFIVVLPMFLIWGAFFSYDFRNIAMLLPAFAICSGFGISDSVAWIVPVFRRAHVWFAQRSALYFVIPGFIAVMAGCFLIPSKVFIDSQRAHRTAIGEHDLNQFLLNYALHNKIEGIVLSNYRMLPAQPYWTVHARFNPLQSEESVRTEMKEPDRQYLLQYGAIAPEVSAYIDSELKRGVFQVEQQSMIALLIRKTPVHTPGVR